MHTQQGAGPWWAALTVWAVVNSVNVLQAVGFFSRIGSGTMTLNRRLGYVMVALSAPTAVALAAFVGSRAGALMWLGPVVYLCFVALMLVVDYVAPVEFRSPARCAVLVPYLVLFFGAILLMGLPMYWLDRSYWLVTVATSVLLIASMVVAMRKGAGQGTCRRSAVFPACAGAGKGEGAGREPERGVTIAGKASKKSGEAGEPVLLSGGNPQIAKGDGDAPVQAYIAAMPGWKSGLGSRLDALIVRHVPDVRKAVRWNSPFYGVAGQGWFLSFHCFTKYVKVTFFNGASLHPLPPGESRDKHVRYLDIRENDPLDEAQFAAWVTQAAGLPGWGAG